jgi:hypothetical protein
VLSHTGPPFGGPNEEAVCHLGIRRFVVPR